LGLAPTPKEEVMKTKTAAGLLAFAMVSSAADPAVATTISVRGNGPNELKAKCTDAKGTFMPPTADSSGSYGCVNSQGHGVYCGGVTPAQKKTCDTFIIVRPKKGLVVARPGGRLIVR
jgi:hypothetical protein